MKFVINFFSRIFLGALIVAISLNILVNYNSNFNTLNHKLDVAYDKLKLSMLNSLKTYTNELINGLALIGVFTGVLIILNSKLAKLTGFVFFLFGFFTLFSKITVNNYIDNISNSINKFDFNYNVLYLLSILGGVLSF